MDGRCRSRFQQGVNPWLKVSHGFSRRASGPRRRVSACNTPVLSGEPPYNTGGHRFVYRDDYRRTTGPRQAGAGWGRLHGDWLSMMLPRLTLARELLRPAGVIAVSIDDNEAANLRLLLDEVFGPQNFLNTLVWVNNLRGRQITGAGAAGTKEYVHVYARDAAAAPAFKAPVALLKELSPSTYKGIVYPVEHDEHGPYVRKNELYNTNSAFNEQTRPNLVYDLYHDPATGQVRTAEVSERHEFPAMVKIAPKPNNDGVHRFHAFRWSRAKVAAQPHDLAFVEGRGGWKVYTKVRDVHRTTVKDVVTDLTTGEGARDLADLGIPPAWFDYPKPARLVQLLAACATGPDALVLDFFAGSNATAHGVALQNALDGGRRRMIAVQSAEPVPPDSAAGRAGITTVAELTRLRAHRLIERFEQERRHGLRVYRLGGASEGMSPDATTPPEVSGGAGR